MGRGRRRSEGPCMEYLVDGYLCPICGKDYVMGEASRPHGAAWEPSGCTHDMVDLEAYGRQNQPPGSDPKERGGG